jgi:hypothetical protein
MKKELPTEAPQLFTLLVKIQRIKTKDLLN